MSEDCLVVDCDDNCGALEEPQSFEEMKAAYEHWRYHGVDFGCAHGH